MPDLSPEEYEALKDEIRREGIRDRLLVDDKGHIIDGHNRFSIWRELMTEGVGLGPLPNEVRSDLKTDEEKRDKAITLNMARRHLSREQKRAVVENVLKSAPERSNRQIAAVTGVRDKTVGVYRAELETSAEIPQLEKTVGADGKERSRTRAVPEAKPTPDAVPAEIADAYYPKKEAEHPREEAPLDTWSDEERELLKRIQAGETVVINMRRD